MQSTARTATLCNTLHHTAPHHTQVPTATQNNALVSHELRVCTCYTNQTTIQSYILSHNRLLSVGWVRLVGSLKLLVSFAKEPYQRDDILQKRPVILRSLLIVATPYQICVYENALVPQEVCAYTCYTNQSKVQSYILSHNRLLPL